MKKYLIKGVLALFGGALMFSCAENETEYVPLAQQKLSAFEDVFKEIYGEPDPYQDWGFSSGKVEVDPNDSSQVVEVIDLDGDIAVTRAVAFGGNGPLLAFNTANTRSANTNANQWAQSYNVPDPLTAGQKARVQFYFQKVQYPGGTEDKGQINFFMQQVYDGGDDPLTKYSGYSSYSKEVYLAANGTSYITSGEHMDHLTAGTDNEHINNFNNGTCSTNPNVGDNGAPLDTKQHSDEIMLMLNTKTNCFGYANSDDSFVRTDRYRLVAGSVIDQWISDNYSEYKKWLDQHPGVEDAIVDDKWHRSFIGFDFDMLPDDRLYAKNNGNYEYFYMSLNNRTKVWNGSQLVDAASVGEVGELWGNKVLYPYIPGTKTKIRMMIEQSNEYCGTTTTITDAQLEYEINNDGKYANLGKVYELLDDFALPRVNSAGKTWIKVGNCADGYYSDWIVSFLPAGGPAQPSYRYPYESIDEWTQIERGRVFCEDLGRATREDLDYNDVVFDAIIFQNHTKYTKWRETYVNGVKTKTEVWEGPTEATKYYANVEILAAGGTIPITVADYQVHDQFSPKAGITTMVNTRDNNSTAFGSFETRNSAQIGTEWKSFEAKLPNGSTQTYNLKLFEIAKPADNQFIKTIKIVSSFDNAQVRELAGEKGGAPQKFMVPVGTKWTSERKNISLAYPGFDAWVTGGAAPWSKVNSTYTYDQSHNSNSVQLPLVMKARRTISTEGEQALWTGSQQYGSSWSLADMSATLDLDKFYPGDRLRFYGENIGDEAWITVVIGDIKPYFIDSDFPNYYVDATGKKVTRTTGCIEVLLDENSAALLNSKVSSGKVTFQVQGRNFTLTRICRVLFQ